MRTLPVNPVTDRADSVWFTLNSRIQRDALKRSVISFKQQSIVHQAAAESVADPVQLEVRADQRGQLV